MEISVTTLRAGSLFEEDGEIYRVIKYFHQKQGRGNASIKVDARNIRSGKLREFRFLSGARVTEADLERRPLEFVYKDKRKGQLVFSDRATKKRISVGSNLIGEIEQSFLREGETVYAFASPESEELISFEVPGSVILQVKETGSGEKGDTVSSVSKAATLETGAEVQVPMFIKKGDFVKIRTETGEYVERVRDYSSRPPLPN